MKLNKQEIKTIESLEPVLLAIVDLKAQLAFYEAKKSAIESQLQGLDKRKLINGKAWVAGVQVYAFSRSTTAYKAVALDLAAELGFEKIPEAIKIKNTKENNSIKTKLAGV